MAEQGEQEEDRANTRGLLLPSVTATTRPAAAEVVGAGGEQQEAARVEEGAQLTLAIRLLQEEGLVPLQEDIHPRQEEGPIPPTLATHHPPTLLKVGSPPHLLATTTPLPPVLDILLPLLLIPMQLQEITMSMMTTVTQQTQVTVPPQPQNMGHLVLMVGQ